MTSHSPFCTHFQHGILLISDEVQTGWGHTGEHDGIRGNGISTFGGNPLSTAAANAGLDYLLSHDLQRAVAHNGGLIINGLRGGRDGPASSRGGVRGKGLIFAVDLVDPVTGDEAKEGLEMLIEALRAVNEEAVRD